MVSANRFAKIRFMIIYLVVKNQNQAGRKKHLEEEEKTKKLPVKTESQIHRMNKKKN